MSPGAILVLLKPYIVQVLRKAARSGMGNMQLSSAAMLFGELEEMLRELRE